MNDATTDAAELSRRLESQVEDRTSALLRYQERLRGLLGELNLVEQRTRRRIAEELHDNLAQLLVLSRMMLDQMMAGTEEERREAHRQVNGMLAEAIACTSSLVSELAPTVLYDLGLPAALEWLGEYMRRYDLTVTVTVDRCADAGMERLAEEEAVPVFQAVRELLLNVARHSGVSSAQVALSQRHGTMRIEVSDEGAGFDSTANATGFGLFGVRERMHALGGTLEIRSAPGAGTRALLALPLKGCRAGESGDAAANAGSSSNDRRKSERRIASEPAEGRLRILLVDDHVMIRAGLRSVLEMHAELEVVGEARDGVHAVELAGALEPAVVVMDISMPRMSGIEATALIRQALPAVIVIGLSVDTDRGNADAMRKAGAAALVAKDRAAEQLHAVIREQVAARR